MSQVSEARKRFYLAREAVEQAQARLYEAKLALELALRQYGKGAPEAEVATLAERSAAEQLQAKRQQQAEIITELSDVRREALGSDMDADIASLDVGYPIALLPVRIETRFDTSVEPAILKIRIYPDEILADSHEAALMPRESEAGRGFWLKTWAAINVDERKEAWSRLVASFGARRAAWIATATTPTNEAERGIGEPVFHDLTSGIRTHAWTRAVEARLLPDRWIALAFRDGHRVRSAESGLVSEPLALTVSPDPSANQINLSENGPTITEDAAWTLDYARALAVGMAIDLPLDSTDLDRGFDQLIVLGVKSTMQPAEASRYLHSLLDAHRFTRGVAFEPQGTPTNNTPSGATSFPPSDLGGIYSFAAEHGVLPPLPIDGKAWAVALGLDASVVEHVSNTDLREQELARAMLNVLWPATLGYFLEQMMDPVFSTEDIRAARQWALNHVRGRGHFPTFRVGNTPYGLLPITSLARWAPAPGALGAEAHLPDALRGLLPFWQAATGAIPRIGGTGDADADLIQSLAMDASTREVYLRCAIGPDLLLNGLALGGVRARQWLTELRNRAQTILATIGGHGWAPRVAYMSFADWPDQVDLPLVTATALSEDGFSTPPYVRAIRQATIDQLRGGSIPDVGPPATLLDHLLRYAALREYTQVAFELNVKANWLRQDQRREPELVDLIPNAKSRGTPWSLFELQLSNPPGKLRNILTFESELPGAEDLTEFGRSLALLERASSAELERLFTETLDVASHRLDAWITALARQRLSAMRDARPSGIHLGAYAWVENLRPRSGTLPNGGFIHAPSMEQATTAAVLRNAYLSRAGERDADDSPRHRYAIDLSSRRVRNALELLDEVRQGQPLGAVLGYRIERLLHDHDLPLDRYFTDLRELYPLVAFKSSGGEPPAGVSAESVAARNVVDGLALWTEWRIARENEANRINFFARRSLPRHGSEEAAVLSTVFDAIDELLDAFGDLLTAEGVHQATRGNMSAAAASLDSISRGARPPNPDIIQTRRSGIVLTHRVALILGGDAPPTVSSWSDLPTSPRATTEPFLDAFASCLFGNPVTIRFAVSYRFANGTATTPVRLTLADITHAGRSGGTSTDIEGRALRAIDLLAIARSTPPGSLPRELELRIADAVGEWPADTDMVIDDVREAQSDRTLSEVLEIAYVLNAALATSRPLRPEDLRRSEETRLAEIDGRSSPVIYSPESTRRVTAACDSLAALASELGNYLEAETKAPADAALILSALRRASLFGIAQAYPELALVASDRRRILLARAQVMHAELIRRQTLANARTDPAEIAQAIFGEDYQLLSSFLPDNAEELDRARAISTEPVSGLDDTFPVRTWFQRAARVRPALARWRKLSLYMRSSGTPTDDFSVAQLPAMTLPNWRWAALPFRNEDDHPKTFTLSLALHEPFGPPPASVPWTGLLLDAWPELIPDRIETTGIAFHYDDPGAEASQAILLAVPPDLGVGWSLDALAESVRETLDLAKVRLVDSELLNSVCQFLPAIYLTDNARGEAIVMELSHHLVRERPR